MSPGGINIDTRRHCSYKDNACPNAIAPVTPQAAFLTYQTHASVQNFWNPYINASQVINAAGKEFISMLAASLW